LSETGGTPEEERMEGRGWTNGNFYSQLETPDLTLPFLQPETGNQEKI